MIRMTKWQCGEIDETRRSLEDAWVSAVEVPRRARGFIRRADWLRERFPEAELRDVERLVKLFKRGEIKSHDWNLTSDRYVGAAPEEEDEDFEFEEALWSIHIDLVGLDVEAAELVPQIARNFEELAA